MVEYQIIEVSADTDHPDAYQPYGAAADLWLCKAHQVIISGPAETGKTRAALEKLNALLWKYKGAQGVMIRKRYTDMRGSCIQTWEKKVLGNSLSDNGPITKYGGESPQFYQYPHGSRLWVGGLDNPGKTLSSERDFAYINQAEELTLNDWETLTTRVTGRAGNAPYAQVFGDCNPGGRTHWILEREREGKLKLFHSRHEDNPVLFDPETGLITEQGQRSMAVLDALSGVRYSRLRKGLWVSVEGQIYEFDPALHVVPRFEIPTDWRRFRVIDFGLSHPFVCQWYAIDYDGRMFMYREIYMTGRTVATHAARIKELSAGERIEQTICDHDAEDRLTLIENKIPNIPAKKAVSQGIGKVQDRLRRQADGRPRIYFLEDSLIEVDQTLKEARKPYRTIDEFDGYIWADTTKEQPVKEEDHGMDVVRYMTMHLDTSQGWSRGMGQ